MKLFACQHCSNTVYFGNTVCVACGHRLGYLPERFAMTAVVPEGAHWRALADPDSRYLFCDNAHYEACNWLVPASGDAGLCRACRHNRTVPDLTQPENLVAWRKIEQAKRHLFYSLMRWRLPLATRTEDAEAGLAFDALAEVANLNDAIEVSNCGVRYGT